MSCCDLTAPAQPRPETGALGVPMVWLGHDLTADLNATAAEVQMGAGDLTRMLLRGGLLQLRQLGSQSGIGAA